MINRKEYRLGDICTKIGSGSTPRGGGDTYLDEGEFALVRSQNILDFKFSYDGLAYINTDQADKLKNVSLEERDILLNITGDSVARVCQVPNAIIPARVNQHVAIIRPNQKILNPEFLKYYLLNPFFKDHMLMLSSSGATRNAITKGMIEDFKINAPDIETQSVIAEILSSLDDKIEINNQINRNSEALAQALFKQCFVDFEFPNENGQPYKSCGGEMVESELGDIPKSWSVVTLQELLEVKYGKDHKHLSDGKTPVYGSGGIMRYADKALYANHSILIPRKGTLSNLFYVSSPFWSVDTMFYTIIKEDYLRKYLYYTIKALDLASMNVGSAVPSMTTKVLNDLKVIRPNENTLIEFERVISSTFEYSESLSIENQQLSSLRDSILPKLISGDLEVRKLIAENIM